MGAYSTLSLTASLLQLRGAQLVEPPLQDAAGNVLLFNGATSTRLPMLLRNFLRTFQMYVMLICCSGEVFGGLAVEEGQNDGAALLSALAARSPADESPDGRVVAVLSALRGPWAFVYWQAAAGRLWFGRDAVGAPPRGCLRCSNAQLSTVPVTEPSQLWRQA